MCGCVFHVFCLVVLLGAGLTYGWNFDVFRTLEKRPTRRSYHHQYRRLTPARPKQHAVAGQRLYNNFNPGFNLFGLRPQFKHVPFTYLGTHRPPSPPRFEILPSTAAPQVPTIPVRAFPVGPVQVRDMSSVNVECGEARMTVRAKLDLFMNGIPIDPESLTLGDAVKCKHSSVDEAGGVVIFDVRLQDCGSSLTMTEDSMVYSNTLHHGVPPSSSSVIVRRSEAVVPIECIYDRRANVSSNAIVPTWASFTSTKSAENVLDFRLDIMTDDWSAPRTSNLFYLDEVINIEASVDTQNQLPMRLFVDSCVATLSSDVKSKPRYMIVDHNGCLMDGTQAGSSASFRYSDQDPGKLQFSIQAFLFFKETHSSIFITCRMKVTSLNQTSDPLNKACSFSKDSNQWTSVDDDNSVCACCAVELCPAPDARRRYFPSAFHRRFRRGRAAPDYRPAVGSEGDVTIGPLVVADRAMFLSKAGTFPSFTVEQDEGVPLAAVFAAVSAIACSGVLAVLILYKKRDKASAYDRGCI
ncbi:zona pellucida sperm-binding protein 3-like [Acipenser ruthenus]|uniref:zona pellucida sperm-binding protein 3-like n=1 Tax=Acipenser ruthenus TaxID=7906 RepID=UPI002740ED36|nr:zona pellucida sperm-binding protein 3-like [Acipenser ruthenus]